MTLPRFKIDENLPVDVATFIRKAGYDAQTVLEEDLCGTSDNNLIEVCQAESRILVSLDTDFSNILSYPPGAYCGMIVLRLRRQNLSHVMAAMSRIAPFFEKEDIVGRLWIVEEKRIRVRG